MIYFKQKKEKDMEIKVNVIASTKIGYQAPKEELDRLGGLTAGICYLPDTTEKLFSEPKEKTERLMPRLSSVETRLTMSAPCG